MRASGTHLTCGSQWALVFALMLIGCASVAVAGAEPQERTLRAYGDYSKQASDVFTRRVRDDSTWWTTDAKVAQQLKLVGVVARPAREDGIIKIAGGLVHHWVGVAFVPNAPLATVVNVSQAYADYATMYKPVIASQLLGRDGNRYRVRLRLKEGVGMVSAVLDVWSVVQYSEGDRRASAISEATEIRQVEDTGQPGERHLPAGEDSGYLWQASTFSRYLEAEEGVYVELETLGLSREFPPFLGWMIEPIARRLGRASVEASLKEFRHALSQVAARDRL